MQKNIKDEFTRIAREYILKEFGDNLDILEEDTEECEDTFCFHYNSKKFIQTRRFEDQFVGPGPLFILKRDKKVISYGSAQGGITARVHLINQLNKERLIRVYYKDYDIWDGKYDLIINKVEDEACGLEDIIIENIVNILLKHKIWKANQYDSDHPNAHYYTEEELKETLLKSPLILKRNFCENLEDLLVDIINKDIYLDWTLSEAK
ncbi:hypothetical protein [Chryseobacterium sp. GVT01B]|uniref:hypothetical protein n=1 Tax=Chryseobacterium sp. GVT01B TaxID=2862675 RepID=UPI001CBED769|nr:hypothetical protein [Chryseobacterium sp. GVT01B]